MVCGLALVALVGETAAKRGKREHYYYDQSDLKCNALVSSL